MRMQACHGSATDIRMAKDDPGSAGRTRDRLLFDTYRNSLIERRGGYGSDTVGPGRTKTESALRVGRSDA